MDSTLTTSTTTKAVMSPEAVALPVHFDQVCSSDQQSFDQQSFELLCPAVFATALATFAVAVMSAPAAALGTAVAVMAVMGAYAAFGRSAYAAAASGNRNGRGFAPIAFRPFVTGSWHLTTTEKKKGHSQRERCT